MSGDIGATCRLCASSTSDTGICLLDSSHQKHAEEIASSLKLEINAENGFPTKICFNCLLVLTNWITLKQKSESCHQHFCKFLGVSRTCGQIVTKTQEREETLDGQKIIIIKPTQCNPLAAEDPLKISEELNSCGTTRNSSESLSHSLVNQTTNIFNSSLSPIPKFGSSFGALPKKKVGPKRFQNCSTNEFVYQNVIEGDFGQYVLDPPEQNDQNFNANNFREPSYDNKFEIINTKQVQSDTHSQITDLQVRQNIVLTKTKDKIEFGIQERDCKIVKNQNDFEIVKEEASGQKMYQVESENTTENWKMQKVKCPLCQSDYFESNLVLHLKTNHNISDAEIPKYFQHQSLSCGYCGENFNTYYKLQKHEQAHIFPYRCVICKQRFKSIESMLEHRESHSEIDYICDFCNLNLTSKSNLSRHIEKEHLVLRNIQCKYCSSEFETQVSHDSHVNNVHKSNKLAIKCNHCKSYFKFVTELQKHYKEYHPQSTPFMCKVCNKNLSSKRSLMEHTLTVHEKEKYCINFVCSICPSIYFSKYMYIQHCKNLHKDSGFIMDKSESFTSEYIEDDFLNLTNEELAEKDSESLLESSSSSDYKSCDRDFTSLPKLGHSMRFVKGIDGSTSCFPTNIGDTLTSKEPPDEVKKKCPICVENLIDRDMPQHLVTVHNVSDAEIPKYMKTNLKYCSYCGKSYKRSSELNRHLLIHTSPFQCKICENRYTSENECLEHEATHTEFTCDVCKENFDSKLTLLTHIETQHFELSDRIFNFKPQTSQNTKTQKPLNQCKYCKLSFKFPAHLQLHKIQYHPEVMPSCNICGKIFTLKRCLLDHIKNKHEQYYVENPWVCEVCQKQFTFQHNLINHKKTHSQNSIVKKTWTCNVCNKRLTSKRNLLRHQNTHDKSITTTPWQCHMCFKYLSSKRNLTEHSKVHSKLAIPTKSWECNICEKQFTLEHNLLKHFTTHHESIAETEEMMVEVKPELLHQICYEDINDGEEF